jgi:cardiolipin synthase
VIFVGAGITDALDGLLAKALRQQTTLGAYLDPIADKLLLATAFVGLTVLGVIPRWLTVLVIARDVIILVGILVLILTAHRVVIRPALTSKANTVFQVVTVIACLFAPYWPLLRHLLEPLFWATCALTCISGFQYMCIGSKLINAKGG